MIKVASYCRVSTDKDDQTNSFEAQQRYFREYIEHKPDWELYEVYADEGITGTSTQKRVHFNRMIQDAYAGKFQLIVTKEISRFSRNILDTIAYTRELKAIGVGVQFVIDGINTLNPDAELYLSIMASLAQEESRKTSSRVVWGQTRQMEKGIVFGPSLLGYDVKDGKISVNPEGAEIIQLIFQKYTLEQVCTSEIARFLTQKGVKTLRGGTKWTSNTIVKILKNEKYVGDLVQKKTYTPDYLSHEKRRNDGAVPLIHLKNHHEPIIDRDLWNKTQELLIKNNKHKMSDTGHSNRYIFSGKIKCGECGASFVGRFKYLKNGSKIRRWSCGTTVNRGRSACSIGKLVRDDDAMQILKTAINHLQIDTEAIIRHVTTLALDAIRAGEAHSADHLDQIQYEIDRIQKKKTIMLDSFFSGELKQTDMHSMTLYYDRQLACLHNKLANAKECKNSGKDIRQLKSDVQSEITSILTGKTESAVFYKTMVHTITVFKDRHLELRLNHLPHAFYFTE